MMAKPAATKIRVRNKLQDRPPRPDPPLFRHLPPPPLPETRRRRSLRPRRRRQLSEDDSYDFDREEEEEERGQKKIRLVVKLPLSPAARPRRSAAVSSVSSSSSSPSPSPSPSAASSSSSSYVDDDAQGDSGEEEEETVKPLRKRRINHCGDVAALQLSRSRRPEMRRKSAVERSSGDCSGNLPASRSGIPMPMKKELELILHKLQKNDIYGAFAEPVDPEELPDYHDVIEHPMDFATVRKKLARGAYGFFEQFEDDVLLICSNAMQYNAPDTVYFRHACVIQDLARKKFQNVRDSMIAETDKLTEEKSRLSSIEKKTQLARCAPTIQRKAVVEPHLSDIYSGATLASTSDTYSRLSTVNGIEKSLVGINGLLDASSRRGSKKEKSVVNELLDASTAGESKKENAVAVPLVLDSCSSLGESKQKKSVAVNKFLDVSSSPKENKLENSVAVDRLRNASSSLDKQEKSVAVNRSLDTSSSPKESKLEKSVAVNKVLDACSSPGESKQERSVAVSGLLDGSSSLGESKQEKSVAVNGLDACSSLGENQQDKGDDFSAKSSPSKLGRKPVVVDVNRRATYSITPEQKLTVESNFVLDIFEDEQKQLVPVGLDAEHSYARSLAQFAASLGPLAWKIASEKIEKSLPSGIKFGPGWVGEYEPLPAPFLSVVKHNVQLTNSSTSSARTDTKDKVAETNPKKHLAAHRKAPITSKSTSCNNSEEQKPRHLGVCSTAQSKIDGTFGQKQCNNSSNISSGVSNQTSNRKTYIAPVRVKEECPSEEITERRQELIRSDDLTLPSTQSNSQKPKNLASTFTNVSPQVRIVNPSPSSNDRHTSIPGMFSRESSHMQSEKEFRAISSQNLNNAPDIAVGGLNNVTRVNNSLPFISTNQTGVNYGFIHGNGLEKASSNPFKSVAFPGKIGNQQNLPMSIVSPVCKENFSPATSAARAWMSVGTSAQWKPVEGKNTSEKSNISSPFSNPSWRPPAQFTNGDSANLLLQTEAPQVRNRGLVIFPQLIPTDLSKYKNHPHWNSSSPLPQNKKRDNLPPDLNIGYQPPTSPIQPSNLAMDSQQPDLALQL